MLSSNEKTVCAGCGEPVKGHWKFCPVCETALSGFTCAECGMPVDPNWKMCPECGTRLVCKSCGKRFPRGAARCPWCTPSVREDAPPESSAREPVTGMHLVYVPEGSFLMGDPWGEGSENEQPVHEVWLDGFYMGRYLVTQAQWLRVMGENPSGFVNDLNPVEQITWADARRFIQRLSEANQPAFEFSLPTEAQWEYAARSGGRKERYSGGDRIETVAWYQQNSEGRTRPVGKKEPNGLGLYDMSGNVWEWCLDTFRWDAYQHHAKKNPVITDDGPDRVIRGGSWNLDAWSARCTRRFGFLADMIAPGLGFRLVMTRKSTTFG